MSNARELAWAVMGDIVAWLTANGIDPNLVPETAVPQIANGEIICDVYLLTNAGRKYLDATGEPAKGVVAVPLAVEPPPLLADWLASRRT